MRYRNSKMSSRMEYSRITLALLLVSCSSEVSSPGTMTSVFAPQAVVAPASPSPVTPLTNEAVSAEPVTNVTTEVNPATVEGFGAATPEGVETMPPVSE